MLPPAEGPLRTVLFKRCTAFALSLWPRLLEPNGMIASVLVLASPSGGVTQVGEPLYE